MMNNILLLAALILSLAACKTDANREVVLAETPDGHPFHFMPIYEDGVTDITITVAWPMDWAYEVNSNPAVPYVAAEAVLSGGTDDYAPQDVLELFNDNNSGGQLYVRANHVIGELSFPKEHIEAVVSIVGEMLESPQFNQPWIDRIKQGLSANQTQFQAQTANQMWAVARFAILGEEPLNDFLSLPNLAAIEDVGIDDLRRWHTETIVKDGLTIVVTGAISPADAGKAVDQLLSSLPNQQVTTAQSIQPDFSPRTILLHLPDAEKTTLGFVGQLPPTSVGGDLVDLLALNFFARSGSGPLFNAVRTELRASYGFQAGLTNYDRATRIMFIAGEVETAKLAEAAEVVLETYEAYRVTPDLTDFNEMRDGIAHATAQNVQFVDVAARTILELALDGRSAADAPRLGVVIESIMAVELKERLLSIFPSRSDLIIVAASPDASALPGACIVTKLEQIAQCP